MPSQQIADESLLIAVGQGDKGALSELFRRHGGRLQQIAFRVTRNAALADEAIQDGFVGIWQSAQSFDRTKGSAIGWMVRIVRFKAIDLVRKSERGNRLKEAVKAEPTIESEAAVGLDNIVMEQEKARVHSCLQRLDEGRQLLIKRAFLEGLSHSELASSLGQPLGSIKSSIRRGLISLRACMEEGQ